MSRIYEAPELNIRKYNVYDITYTASTPETGDTEGGVDLNEDDTFDPFA